MKTYIFFIISILFSINLYCSDSTNPANIYRVNLGKVDNYTIYVVDGPYIRKNIFGEFVYGGNPARYPFIPEGEIWIDNSISSTEYKYTLLHELNECGLMYRYNMNYYDAHDSSLALEVFLRNEDAAISEFHEKNLSYVYPIDFDSTKEIAGIPDSIKLSNIYIYKLQIFDTLSIWIVDGSCIRKNIYPDFAFSGNSKAYKFIPEGEIWIDGSVSCEEIKYSALLEKYEEMLISKGFEYDNAYTAALEEITKIRKLDEIDTAKKPFMILPALKFRETVN